MQPRFRYSLLFALAAGLTALCTAGRAQEKTPEAKDDPSAARMRKDITFLASDECEGRGVGTLGLDLAAQYIAANSRKAGLKPGGVNGTYFQPFPFATGAKLDGDSTLVLQWPKEQKITLKQGDRFPGAGHAPRRASSPPRSSSSATASPRRGSPMTITPASTPREPWSSLIRRLPRWTSKDKPFDGAFKDDLAALDAKHSRAQLAKAKPQSFSSMTRPNCPRTS